MLESKLRRFLYFILRNDLSWASLNVEEKKQIKLINLQYNNERDDYKNPDKYQGGKSFVSGEDRTATWEGRQIQSFLENIRPASILEIGPGSGYYTRQLLEYPSVREYCAVDVNAFFLDFLRDKISGCAAYKHLSTSFVHSKCFWKLNRSFDAIVLLSSVHHIPDRAQLFEHLEPSLTQHGAILAIDPSHTLPRVLSIIRNCLHKKYLTAPDMALSTHHFCSRGEYHRICDNGALDLALLDTYSEGRPEMLRRKLETTFKTPCFDYLLSTKIAVILRKK
ncbi:class I SAM-dependent methyltransferase [Oleidesulfovibrio alaskensis]